MRYIGIRPRVKTRDKGGKERPTNVIIIDGEKKIEYKLNDEQDEYLFIMGKYPIAYRAPEADENLSEIPAPHLKLVAIKKDENVPEQFVHIEDGKRQRIAGVASAFDGVRKGDIIGIGAGGIAGNDLSVAIARRGEEAGATLLRLTPSRLKERRGDASKDDDAKLLAQLVRDESDAFYKIRPSERDLMKIFALNDLRIEAMKDRMAAVQRADALSRNAVFHGNGFRDLDIRRWLNEERAKSPSIIRATADEKEREAELKRFVEKSPLYEAVFEPIPGMGPLTAARIIAAVGDLRRFIIEPDSAKMQKLYEVSAEGKKKGRFDVHKVLVPEHVEPNPYFRMRRIAQECEKKGLREDAKHLMQAAEAEHTRAQLRRKAYCSSRDKFVAYIGLHVQSDGSFPKRQKGRQSNWSNDARSGFYNFGVQQLWAYQAKSPWGVRMREYRMALRQKHPEPVSGENGNGKLYTDAHINRMALWRTLTRVAQREIFKRWYDYYRREGLL